MKNKRLFLLVITAAASFTSCDFSNEKEDIVKEEAGTFESDTSLPATDTKKDDNKGTTEEKSSDKQEEKPSTPTEEPGTPSQEEDDEVEVEEVGVDFSKENYTLTWDTGENTVVQNNIPRGEYPEFGEIPVKASNKAGYMNHFIGWSKDEKATAGLNESELAPVVRDTTYHALYEEVESYKVTVKTDWFSKTWKEFDVPKNTKITSDLLNWDSLPVPEPEPEKSYKVSHLIHKIIQNNDPNDWDSDFYDSIDEIPVVTSDMELSIAYTTITKKYNVYFYNQGNLYTGDAFEGYFPMAKGENINQFNSSDKKMQIYKMPDPVKVSNGKMYKFLGWNENSSATTGTKTADLSKVVQGETKFYAIFSSTADSDAALCYYSKSTGTYIAKTFDAVVSDGNKFSVTNGAFSFTKNAFPASNVSNFNVYLPDNKSITTLASGAFNGYTGLTSIRLPSTLTSLPENAFKGCTGLVSVDISACTNLKNIPASAFEGCSSLVEIKGFNNIQTIGNKAFSGCKSLKLPSLTNVTSIGEEAFKGTSGDTNGKVTIPTSVKTISKGAFTDGSFKEVEIKNGSIITISPLTFANNSELTKVSIPAGVSTISYESGNSGDSNNPFQGSDNITSLNINSSNSNYYSYKNSIIKKSNNALIYGNASTIISDKVKIINGYSFYKSEITRIRIPSSITSLNHQAFVGAKLNRIDYDGTKAQFKAIIPNSMPLYGLNQDVKIHCSDGILTSNGTSLS